MHRSRMSTTPALILTLFCAGVAVAGVLRATEAPEKIVVVGTLVAKDGLPVAGRNVFLFLVSDNQLNLDVKEGKLVNPMATTDSHGKFTLEANGDYLKEDQLFTVGMRSPSGELVVPERAGSSLILRLTKSGRAFDVGAVSVQK